VCDGSFDDVRAILFIVNLAGYNQVLFEDNSKNRIEEELELFEKVAHNPIFAETPIFLFLNKKDLFESMIKETDLKVIFKVSYQSLPCPYNDFSAHAWHGMTMAFVITH
jgi:GTPase SAR1 family protein